MAPAPHCGSALLSNEYVPSHLEGRVWVGAVLRRLREGKVADLRQVRQYIAQQDLQRSPNVNRVGPEYHPEVASTM